MKIFLPALFLSIVPAVLAAPTGCVAGSYASYQALVGGCSIGDAVFSNFSNLSFVNSGVSALTANEIEVTPSGSSTDATLTFMYLNANGATAPVVVNAAGQVFAFGLNFDIAAMPSILTDIQMNSTFSNTSPGSVTVTKTAQLLGGPMFAPSTVSDGGLSNPMGTYSGAVIPVSGLGTFQISDVISLQAQSGSVTQTGFANSFGLEPEVTATAEVGSLTMIGSGLIFLSLMASSSRWKNRART